MKSESIKNHMNLLDNAHTIFERNTHIVLFLYGVGSSIYLFANELIVLGIINVLGMSIVYWIENQSNKKM